VVIDLARVKQHPSASSALFVEIIDNVAMTELPIAGLLLAAGEGRRFGGDKLQAVLTVGPQRGTPVGIAAYRTLDRAIPGSVVVLRQQDVALRRLFEHERARIVIAQDAARGLARSLAAGVEQVDPDCGIVVALADMPWIQIATIQAIAQAVRLGATIAAPRYRGRRGHPVGFAPVHRAALLALQGDEGARAIVESHRDALSLVDVDDAGILSDIDTPADLVSRQSGGDDDVARD
jgi:molybdenum cofactor cytidylyltransferase